MSGHTLTIETEIWGQRCVAYVRREDVQILLPAWSGQIPHSEAREGIAALRALLDRAEALIRAAGEAP